MSRIANIPGVGGRGEKGERNISRHRCAFWRGGVDVYFVLFLLSLGRNCIFNCDWVAKNSGGVERASG